MGGGTEKHDTCVWRQFNGGVIPSFTTKGRAKAIWFTYRVTALSTDANTYTNVNPVTGEINNDGLYRYLFNGTYELQSARSFIVTDNSVAMNNPLSSSQVIKAILSYTYE